MEKVYGLPCELVEIKESAKEQKIVKALNSLGSKCQEIIRLFYYSNYSNEAIMHRMNYENENTVKAHKSRCIKKLRTLIQQKIS